LLQETSSVIVLYAFAPAFGLPSPGPFAMKTEVHLKMMGLAYDKRFEGYASAPKGKLPYIDDGGIVVADSTFIRLHLEKRYKFDLDAGFSAEQRARAWAVERLVEDQLYWAMVYTRWAVDENFNKGPSHFFDRLPDDVRQPARQKQRDAVIGYLRAQGLGRHSLEEIAKLSQLGYTALAELLGDKPYLLGDQPCGADASVFGQLASVLTPWFESPVREAAYVHSNLREYSQRMMAAYFPEYA
jgi:glutathione S-transferase